MKQLQAKVAVIGGGPAGICAALSAARRGMSTLLIHNRPMFGGNSSSEIRVWTRGAVGGGNLYAEEMGVWGELKLTNLYRNPDANPVFWDETILDLVMQQENLQFLLNTEISDLGVKDGHIQWAEGEQQGTERRYHVEADVFIDATGDSTLGAKAGLSYYVGEQIHSSDGSHSDDREVLCSSILFNTRKEDHPVPFVAPDYAYSMEYVEKLVGRGGRLLSESMGGSDCWWFEYGGSLDTIDKDQDIAIELKKLVMGIWNYIKNSGKYNAEYYTLEWIGSIPGKRESRRMNTAYLLKTEDLEQQLFEDGLFYGGWYRDMHPSGGLQDAEKENCIQIPCHVYQIPAACLYSRGADNLLFAGRNIGTEREAFASSRVMNTCAMAGQAAGELAAMLIEKHCSPWTLSEQALVQLRLRLVRGDMFLPGAELRDPDDLAQKTTVTASSTEWGSPGADIGLMSLAQGGYVIFPAVGGKTVRLLVEAAEDTQLQGSVSFVKLPNRLIQEPVAFKKTWQVAKGRQKLELQLPELRQKYFCVVSLAPADTIQIVKTEPNRIGFVCGTSRSPVYEEPALAYEEDLGLYGPEQVLNRVGRPWGHPNLWQAASEDRKAWLELRFDGTEVVSKVQLLLDPSLNEELPSSRAKSWQDSHHLVARTGMPVHLLRDFTVCVQSLDGTWEPVLVKKENYLRNITASFAPRPVCAVRLKVERTWGKAPAVYGFRIYG